MDTTDLRIERGIRSREHLYKTAKEVFSEFGYEKTTFKKISIEANMPLSSLTYYFGTKDKLVSAIYNDYIERIYSFFRKFEWFSTDTRLFQHSLVSLVFYNNILRYSNAANFYFEVLEKSSNERILGDFAVNLYSHYVLDYSLNISRSAFNALLSYDFGGRREIFLNYYHGSFRVDIDELIDLVVYMMPKAMLISKKEILRVMHKSKKMLSDVDYSSIRLF